MALRTWVRGSRLNFVLKLSEKGYEQRSERGFGRYIGAETGRIVPLRCPGRPRLSHLRTFSDSFFACVLTTRSFGMEIKPIPKLLIAAVFADSRTLFERRVALGP